MAIPQHTFNYTKQKIMGLLEGSTFYIKRRMYTMVTESIATYVDLLQGCIQKKALSEGRGVHAHINKLGFTRDIVLGNTIINMYVKCGSVVDARRFFDGMAERDVCSWTLIISACARHGPHQEALKLFCLMRRSGVQPNHFTFSSLLPACAGLASLQHGFQIHQQIIRSGFESHLCVMTALLDMYARCGVIEIARNLFEKMSQRDLVSWNAMLAGYTQNGLIEEALKLFNEMPKRNVVSWNAIIAGYAQNGFVDKALEFFEEMPQRNEVSWNAMVSGFAQNGFVDEALKLYEEMPQQNVVSWTAIIGALAQNGHSEESLKLFRQMQLVGIRPDAKTFASVLPACATLASLEQGTDIHEEIKRGGFESNATLVNALIDMYAKCGSIGKARELFDTMQQRDLVSWNAMITGYLHNRLVDEAQKLFLAMPRRNLVSWNVMIAGFAQNGHNEQALELFQEMRLLDVKPDLKTFTNVLPSCANLAALEQGRTIHEEVIRNGFQSEIVMINSLINMYAKCGSIEQARELFENMHHRDEVSWNAMIAGYAMHGYGKEALKLFEHMKHSGISPGNVTLVSVLSACSHAGLVNEGYQYFNCMTEYYDITPAIEHYICIVDLLGRAGQLDEAQDFINKMPISPNAVVWSCLLGACRIHNNIGLGECVAEHLFVLDPKNAAPYVLLSNMYAAAGRWDDIEKLRKKMKDVGIRKTPGCSWIEVDKQVHCFLVGDRSAITDPENLYQVGELFL